MKNIIGDNLNIIETNEIGFASIDDISLEELEAGVDLAPYVFLGGTCGDSTWRGDLIPLLEAKGIKYFNPIVADWDESAQEFEEYAKANAAYELYVITSDMSEVYSIAEATLAAVSDTPSIFMFMENGFDNHQIKSLVATSNLIEKCGGMLCYTLDEVADLIYGFENNGI